MKTTKDLLIEIQKSYMCSYWTFGNYKAYRNTIDFKMHCIAYAMIERGCY